MSVDAEASGSSIVLNRTFYEQVKLGKTLE